MEAQDGCGAQSLLCADALLLLGALPWCICCVCMQAQHRDALARVELAEAAAASGLPSFVPPGAQLIVVSSPPVSIFSADASQGVE